MLPQHLAGIVLKNVIIHNIFFYFIFIFDVYFTLYFCFMFYFILSHYNQLMLLLFYCIGS